MSYNISDLLRKFLKDFLYIEEKIRKIPDDFHIKNKIEISSDYIESSGYSIITVESNPRSISRIDTSYKEFQIDLLRGLGILRIYHGSYKFRIRITNNPNNIVTIICNSYYSKIELSKIDDELLMMIKLQY